MNAPSEPLEPLTPFGDQPAVSGTVYVFEQRIGVGPNRHVDQLQRVDGRLDVDGAVAVADQSPHETGALFGERVDAVELVEESLDFGVTLGRNQSSDVDLGEVPLVHREHLYPSDPPQVLPSGATVARAD